MGRPHIDSGTGHMKRTQPKLKKQNQLKTKKWQLFEIQQRIGNIRIDSGDQNKPIAMAYFSMLKGSWIAVNQKRLQAEQSHRLAFALEGGFR